SLITAGAAVAAMVEKRDETLLANEHGCWAVKLIPGEKLPKNETVRIEIHRLQKKNCEGYDTLAVDDVTKIKRFLILGTTGGTFYAKEQKLTMANVESLKEIIIRGQAHLILDCLKEVSLSGKSQKQESLLLSLALCSRFGVSALSKASNELSKHVFYEYLREMHKEATGLVNHVCRTATQLFSYVAYCEMVSADIIITKEEEVEKRNEEPGHQARKRKTRETLEKAAEAAKPVPKSTGWGRVMRKCIQNWYLSKTPEELAVAVTKYRSRNGWSHRDLLRLSHPIPRVDHQRIVFEHIFYYATKGECQPRKRLFPADSCWAETVRMKYTEDQLAEEDTSEGLLYLERVSSLSPYTPEDEIIWSIRHFRLTWEMIPSKHLNSKEVWKAIVERMPMLAMIRNLAKMQTVGLFKGEKKEGDKIAHVVSYLTNVEALKKARIHPIQILLAKTVYDSGAGDKGSLVWTPRPELSTALEDAFYLTFQHVKKTELRYCIALDCSSSMCSKLSGSVLNGRTASAAIAMNIMKTEDTVECITFCNKTESLPFTKESKLAEITDHMKTIKQGDTSGSLPMTWATRIGKKFDVFLIFTDNDLNGEGPSTIRALTNYRRQSGIEEAKLIVVSMAANASSIASPDDKGMMDIVGFDPSIPQIIHDFVMGNI
ncbi:hypothetical protein PFISCL1PPCAC_12031, partial [Pristionchus fissidentatus]